MSFLHQLKQQAQTLKSQQSSQQQILDVQWDATEVACKRVWNYFTELPRQLNVIEPATERLSLDGKLLWPEMKQTDFRCDARKKTLRGKEVHDYLALGWRLLPREGAVTRGLVSVNFPPDLERVERRLHAGHVPHERQEQRHPDTNRLLSIGFAYETQARASVLVHADHDKGELRFRLACVSGLELVNTHCAADHVTVERLDELARLIVGQPSSFLSPLQSR
jgi:hypothetical protein